MRNAPRVLGILHLFPQLFGGGSEGMASLEEACYSRQALRV